MKRQDFKQTAEELFLLTITGKPSTHTFTVSAMLLKEPCLLTKLKRRVLPQLSTSLEKAVTSTTMLFQASFTLIQKLLGLENLKNNLSKRVLTTKRASSLWLLTVVREQTTTPTEWLRF